MKYKAPKHKYTDSPGFFFEPNFEGGEVLYDPSTKKRVNVCQKPVDLYVQIIERYTSPGDAVLDLCSGTCAALVAAMQLKRHCLSVDCTQYQVQQAIHRVNKIASALQAGGSEAEEAIAVEEGQETNLDSMEIEEVEEEEEERQESQMQETEEGAEEGEEGEEETQKEEK